MKEDNNKNDIVSVIDILRKRKYYGAGQYTEISKGKYQMVSEWSELKEKIKRLIKQ